MTMDIDELTARNKAFAARGGFDGLAFPTDSALRIVTCVDARVNPSDVLGIGLGEAVIMRNPGGRITPTVLQWWKLLGTVAKEAAGSKSVFDPYVAVQVDVEVARQALPAGLLVSGVVYDVDTGLIDVVVPPAAR